MKYNGQGQIKPKVLVAAPASDRHGHLLDEWLEMLEGLTYDVEVLLVDTSDTEEYFERLKTKSVKGKPLHLIRFRWDCSNHIVQHLANAREKIRRFVMDEGFDYLMSLDDDVFLPKFGVERLMNYDKDCAGFYHHIFLGESQTPCILKSGEVIMGVGVQYFSFKEIDAYVDFALKFQNGTLNEQEKLLAHFLVKDPLNPQLIKPYACNVGCLLIKREVLEKCPFITHPTFIFGEDLWWWNEVVDKKFEFWCDVSIRCQHKNTEWKSVMDKCPTNSNMGFWVAMGPSDAKETDIIDRRENV